MKIKSVIPILYSDDVKRSVEFYTQIIGFTEQWIWDDKSTFGGVGHTVVDIFFCKGDQGHKGTWVAINFDNVDEFYDTIKDKQVETSGPPVDKP